MVEKLKRTTPVPGSAALTEHTIISLLLFWAETAGEAHITVIVKGDNDAMTEHVLKAGQPARDAMKALNKANLTTKSLNTRILKELANTIPGTVEGLPE